MAMSDARADVVLDRPLPPAGFASARDRRASGGAYYRLFESAFDSATSVRKTQPAHYFIATTRRSGSTLLSEAIVEMGDLGVPTEYFDLSMTYLFDLASRWSCVTVGDYLDALYKMRSSRHGLLGAKIHWDQLEAFVSFVAGRDNWGSSAEHAVVHDGLGGSSGSPPEGLTERVVDRLWPQARWIWLRRDDTARQAVSRFIAERSAEWWSYDPRAKPRLSVEDFDFDAISAFHTEIDKQETAWARFFDSIDVTPLEITYEQLVADRDRTLAAVSRFLGQPREASNIDPPVLVRQATDLNDEFALMYASLAARPTSRQRRSDL